MIDSFDSSINLRFLKVDDMVGSSSGLQEHRMSLLNFLKKIQPISFLNALKCRQISSQVRHKGIFISYCQRKDYLLALQAANNTLNEHPIVNMHSSKPVTPKVAEYMLELEMKSLRCWQVFDEFCLTWRLSKSLGQKILQCTWGFVPETNHPYHWTLSETACSGCCTVLQCPTRIENIVKTRTARLEQPPSFRC